MVLLLHTPFTEFLAVPLPPQVIAPSERFSTAHVNVDHPRDRKATFEGQYQSGHGTRALA
jgi:hypothetical protein